MSTSETNTMSESETFIPEEQKAAQERGSDHKKTAIETKSQPNDKQKEFGGREGPDPVRYGDWESKGRCFDF